MKYFGKVLPPKCALRTCWLTDDSVHYYCVDFTCNLHKYRRTKHDRYSRYEHRDPERMARPARAAEGREATPRVPGPLVHFRCPQCASGDIQMRLLQNRYECNRCAFAWR